MIKVLRHGNRIEVTNPVTGEKSDLTNVTFVEEGRGGANMALTESSNFLDALIGEATGIPQQRVHTQPVKTSLIDKFKIGMEIPNAHINRELHSLPQMRQQESVPARLIDGKPTYFKTYLSSRMEDDKDFRVSTEALITALPGSIRNLQISSAEVKILQKEYSGTPNALEGAL